jgi:predicted amidophosphoribosyltransferase
MFNTTICQRCGKLVYIAPGVCQICGDTLGAHSAQFPAKEEEKKDHSNSMRWREYQPIGIAA